MTQEEFHKARAATKAAHTEIRTKAEALLKLCLSDGTNTDAISEAAHEVHKAAERAAELAKVSTTATVTA